MPQIGTLIVRVFTSQAQIPLSGATVAISRRSRQGKHILLAIQVTDENGEIDPILVATPASSGSESPGTVMPFASLDIRVEHPDYVLETIEDVQIFPGVVSLLPVPLLPLSEQASPAKRAAIILIPPQTL